MISAAQSTEITGLKFLEVETMGGLPTNLLLKQNLRRELIIRLPHQTYQTQCFKGYQFLPISSPFHHFIFHSLSCSRHFVFQSLFCFVRHEERMRCWSPMGFQTAGEVILSFGNSNKTISKLTPIQPKQNCLHFDVLGRELRKAQNLPLGTPCPSIGTFLQYFVYPNSFLLQFNHVYMKRM